MSNRALWGCVVFALTGVLLAADPLTGFHEKRRIKRATTLDWDFAAGRGARLPREYDLGKGLYQLFVPPSYKPAETWPLIVVVSSGDAPLEWRVWQKLCESKEMLFCVAHGAGGNCDPTQRIRVVCDMLDQVRRDYRIDPDRTYVAGHRNGAAVALRLVSSLPELFGGAILINGAGDLPRLDELRWRLRERMSVALVCGEKESVRSQMEKFRAPLLGELGIRSKLWLSSVDEGSSPQPSTLTAVAIWLEEDRKRREGDTESNGPGTGHVLAAPALERSRREARDPESLFRAAARLEWISERYRETASGRKAAELLEELHQNAQTSRQLKSQKEVESRKRFVAEANAWERFGRLPEAHRAWREASRLGPVDQRKQATDQADRLARLLTRTPYLGLTFEGESTRIKSVVAGSPAHRAGLRAGDRLDKVGKTTIESPATVRALLARRQPGDEVEFFVLRGLEGLKLSLLVGSLPAE